MTDITLQQFIEENNIAEITYYNVQLLSPYSDLGDEKVDLAHRVIYEKRELLKRKYTEKQPNEFTVMLSEISEEIRRKEIETKILPKCKKYYQAGLPTVLISNINDVFKEYILDKNSVQYKKNREVEF